MQKEQYPLKIPKKHKPEKKNLCFGSFLPTDEGWQELKNPQTDNVFNFQNKAI